MEEEAYHRVSITQRTLIVAGASAADMLVNFPLWICAKCVSAGIPLPSLRNLYKGSGSLYFAMGPLTIVEDRTTAVALDTIGDRLSVDLRHAASACISGGVAALTVGCQIEGIITRSHATGETVLQTAVSTHARGGFASIFVPYGAMMIAAREVPYAGCLFFLSGRIRTLLHGDRDSKGSAYSTSLQAVATDVLAACLTAMVAGPISHVPSVIAAHQQAHSRSFVESCRAIRASSGRRGFLAGLVPRTISLVGSLFTVPFAIERIQPFVERI